VRFDFGADGRCGFARAQKSGAENQGAGQKNGRGRAVEEIDLAADECRLLLKCFRRALFNKNDVDFNFIELYKTKEQFNFIK
jgi:hypothetical protein